MPESEKAPLLEGIYRTREAQPPDMERELGSDERSAKLREGVITFLEAPAMCRLRQLGQDRASAIKDYLVDKGQLEDDRVYFIDAQLGQAEKDGRVVTPMHLDAE